MAKINAIGNSTGSLEIDPGASGDSYVQFSINTVNKYCIGVDDDDGDSFKISTGALGTGDTFVMTAAGERTMPLQCAFLAYLGTTDSNATGDGTKAYVGAGNALTEVYDQNSDFNTNGTFTAPVTGRYLLSISLLLNDIAAGHTNLLANIETSNRNYQNGYLNPGAMQSSGDLSNNYTVIADMDAADTAVFYVNVSGSTKVVDVVGDANISTSFSGSLLC